MRTTSKLLDSSTWRYAFAGNSNYFLIHAGEFRIKKSKVSQIGFYKHSAGVNSHLPPNFIPM